MRGLRAVSLAVWLASALGQGVGSPAPALIPGGEWFNSPPVRLEELRGKVVLINFWVYSCINCHNSLPALRDFYARYEDQGFEIIGVHTPEFESDKPVANVKAAIARDGVTWPVVQDNAFATWRAYKNRYWPAFYLIDRRGNVRYVQTGEISERYPAGIPRLEAQIQKLLAEGK